MDDTIELTSEAKKARITALTDLLQHPGWKIIREEIDGDIKLTEAKLFGEVPLGEKETGEGLQRERIDRIELRDLPQNLIEEYTEEEPEDPALDPYD